MEANTVTLSVLIAVAIMVCSVGQLATASTGSPIVIVPGLLGSRLDVRDSRAGFCRTEKKVGLWLNLFRTTKFKCFSTEMKLKFDESTGYYSNSSNSIKVTVPGFGQVYKADPFSASGDVLVEELSYFVEFVRYFEKRGYEQGKSIRVAPYDWRIAPDELDRKGYYNRLINLIETMYADNDNTPVTIVAHSMGGPVSHYLLTSGVVSQEWKDKYIGNYVTLSAAWGGSFATLRTVITGINPLGLFLPVNKIGDNFLKTLFEILLKKSFRGIFRTFESMPFLFPSPSLWGDEVIVSTPTQEYTGNDYQRLLNDTKYSRGYKMFQAVTERLNRNLPLPHPNVPTHCFYGHGIRHTIVGLRYEHSFPEGAKTEPEFVQGNGDGVLPSKSLRVCEEWDGIQHKAFNGVNHDKIFDSKKVLRDIGEIVGASREPITGEN